MPQTCTAVDFFCETEQNKPNNYSSLHQEQTQMYQFTTNLYRDVEQFFAELKEKVDNTRI